MEVKRYCVYGDPVYGKDSFGPVDNCPVHLHPEETHYVYASEFDRILAECSRLRAQLAEQEALLRDINKRHSSGVDFDLPADLAARVTALSASAEPRQDQQRTTGSDYFEAAFGAEPSAPVERDELLGLLLSMTCSYRSAIQTGFDRITALGGNCDSVDKMLADFPDYAKARAALERMP